MYAALLDACRPRSTATHASKCSRTYIARPRNEQLSILSWTRCGALPSKHGFPVYRRCRRCSHSSRCRLKRFPVSTVAPPSSHIFQQYLKNGLTQRPHPNRRNTMHALYGRLQLLYFNFVRGITVRTYGEQEL